MCVFEFLNVVYTYTRVYVHASEAFTMSSIHVCTCALNVVQMDNGICEK